MVRALFTLSLINLNMKFKYSRISNNSSKHPFSDQGWVILGSWVNSKASEEQQERKQRKQKN